MTRPAGGKLRRRFDMILRHEPSPQSSMVAWRRPGEVKKLVARSEIRCRIAVAIETEFHLESLGSIGEWHLIDAPVAFDAGDPFSDVDVMPKIDVVGHARDAVPQDCAIFGEAFSNRRQHFSIGPELRMAAHTDMRRGKAGIGLALDGRVAVTTVDVKLPEMMLVTERDWLHRRARDDIPILRPREGKSDEKEGQGEEEQTERNCAQPGIGGPGEDLGQLRRSRLTRLGHG